MNFKEKFPSLKDKGIARESLFGNHGEIPNLELLSCWEVFTDSIIQEHCLDKQKVREVIDKIFYSKIDGNRIELLKDLGLE